MRRLMLRWYLFIVFFLRTRLAVQCSEEEEANGEGEIDIYALRIY